MGGMGYGGYGCGGMGYGMGYGGFGGYYWFYITCSFH
jgi:hypothetical protein